MYKDLKSKVLALFKEEYAEQDPETTFVKLNIYNELCCVFEGYEGEISDALVETVYSLWLKLYAYNIEEICHGLCVYIETKYGFDMDLFFKEYAFNEISEFICNRGVLYD